MSTLFSQILPKFRITTVYTLPKILKTASPEEDSPGGILLLKTAMLLMPLAVIVLGYLIYLKKYSLDEKTYAEILADLRERGDIRD
jgi:melibiose permease/lactose/raffinose/galactose permease